MSLCRSCSACSIWSHKLCIHHSFPTFVITGNRTKTHMKSARIVVYSSQERSKFQATSHFVSSCWLLKPRKISSGILVVYVFCVLNAGNVFTLVTCIAFNTGNTVTLRAIGFSSRNQPASR